jgi:serine protease Do
VQIGVNTAIYSPSGGSVGVGFAIPSNRARPVIEQLMVHGRVSRGWLGVQTQELTPAIVHYLDLPNDHGALVADVSKGGPADKAGIQQGDVIRSFAGEEIVKLRDLTRIIADTPAGRTVTVKVWRRGHEVTLEPTIVEQPEHPESAIGGGEERPTAPQRVDALGLGLGVLTPELRKLLSVPAHVKGVVVMQVSSSSPFASIDLQPGDVIISINQEPVLTPQEAATKLKAAQSRENKGTLFHLNREGTNLYVGWPQRNNGG